MVALVYRWTKDYPIIFIPNPILRDSLHIIKSWRVDTTQIFSFFHSVVHCFVIPTLSTIEQVRHAQAKNKNNLRVTR